MGAIDDLLTQRARTVPHRPFLRFREGDITFAEADAQATELSHGLAALGIGPGDLVALLLPNCAEVVLLWMALSRLGAIHAPVNTAFRGAALTHALNVTAATFVVVDEELVPTLAGVADDLQNITTAVVRGDHDAVRRSLPRLQVLPFSALQNGNRATLAEIGRDQDVATVLFTSGTTGRSKGCELSHRYAIRHAELMVEHLDLQPDDVLYCPFPLFHLDAAVLTVMPALVLGTTAAIGHRFSASGFWDEVRAFEATVFDFMGATLTMLLSQPRRDDDADNPARLGWGVPLPAFSSEFEERFAVRLTEVYGLTDAGVVAYEPLNRARRPGSCGKPIPQFEVRLLDESDRDVTNGDVGEIAIRPLEPSLLADGYHGDPEATLATRRNLWFHTGDLARSDDDGYLYFVGRQSDVIRRRGENISSFELEEVISRHPGVLEVAAFGVPSPLTEEDVMVAVVPRCPDSLDPVDLIAFCEGRMARYMVPRYVDLVDALPRTPTEKVEKHRLADRGVTAGTWDREANQGKRG